MVSASFALQEWASEGGRWDSTFNQGVLHVSGNVNRSCVPNFFAGLLLIPPLLCSLANCNSNCLFIGVVGRNICRIFEIKNNHSE